jgi:hypothetical protein
LIIGLIIGCILGFYCGSHLINQIRNQIGVQSGWDPTLLGTFALAALLGHNRTALSRQVDEKPLAQWNNHRSVYGVVLRGLLHREKDWGIENTIDAASNNTSERIAQPGGFAKVQGSRWRDAKKQRRVRPGGVMAKKP